MVEASIGISAIAATAALLFVVPFAIIQEQVDDRGIQGRGLFRREVTIARSDVREATWGTDSSGRVVSLVISLQSVRRPYLLWSGSSKPHEESQQPRPSLNDMAST